MRDYGIVKGYNKPKAIEMTDTAVFIATNVEPYDEVLEDRVIPAYKYNYYAYTKDEYITKLARDNEHLQQSMLDTQIALCDLYEALEGSDA